MRQGRPGLPGPRVTLGQTLRERQARLHFKRQELIAAILGLRCQRIH